MRKIILLIVVLAIIAAGWFLYFNDGAEASIVSLSEAKYMDLENSLEFSGQVVPVTMYSVMSETGGTVDTIHVAEGGRVKAGDALFELDASQLESMLEEAEVNYNMLLDSQSQTVMAPGSALDQEKAKVALALSQTTGYDYKSFNNAFSDTLSQYAEAMASSLSAMQSMGDVAGEPDALLKDKIALAELAAQRLRSQINQMSYKSLIKGTVLAVNINKGEVLAPGMPAMIIADTDETVIEGYVYERDLARLSDDMDVKIIDDDVHYMGRITGIGKAAVDTGEQSSFGSMAKIEIKPGLGFNKITGAVVDLEIVLSSKDDALAVPVECLAEEGFVYFVYVVGKDDMLEKRVVETGFQDTFYVEILSGLSIGEKVVLTPGIAKEGQRVTYDRG